MKRMVCSDNFQFDEVKHAEKSRGKSMTLPGQSFTIEELMVRYNGVPVGIQRVRDFVDEDQGFDDPDVSKIPFMDITERHIAMAENADRINDLQRKLEDQEAEEEAYLQEVNAKADADRKEKDVLLKTDEK